MEQRPYQALTLSEAGKFDRQSNQVEKLTGWGIICRARMDKGISRKDRIKARAERLKKEAAVRLAALVEASKG